MTQNVIAKAIFGEDVSLEILVIVKPVIGKLFGVTCPPFFDPGMS